MKTDKRLIIFIIVFILLIISVIYRVLNPFVHQETDQLKYTGKKPVKSVFANAVSKSVSQKESKSVVDQFLKKAKVSGAVSKDLFAVYSPKRKMAPKAKKILPGEGGQKMQPTEAELKKISLNEVREYIASYTWYGTYKSQDKRAVFLAKNKMVLVARTGDRIDGKYLIEDIQDKYLKIKALDLNETLHLDMREFNDE